MLHARQICKLMAAPLIFNAISVTIGLAQSEDRRFDLSSNYRSSYPAVLYKKAFESDLTFSQRSCFQAMNGSIIVTAFSSVNIAHQCANNLDRLDEFKKYASDYLNRACRSNLEPLKYFTTESTAVLCGGFLTETYLIELDQAKRDFDQFRARLLEFAEKCRRRTGDADGC